MFFLADGFSLTTDYACDVLEEGKMLSLAGSDIICYSKDDYDLNDEIASTLNIKVLFGLIRKEVFILCLHLH
jgi:hypothetical protein